MKRTLLFVFAIAFSVICLWFMFRNVNLPEVGAIISERASAWPWFLLSGLVMMLNIIFRGFRYKYILSEYPQISLKSSVTMTAIMFMGNSIFPFRAGEAIRVFIPVKKFGIPLASSASCHGADRLFDLVGLLAVLFLSLFFAGESIAADARTAPIEFFGAEYTLNGLITGLQNSSITILVIGLTGVVAVFAFPKALKRLLGGVARPFGKDWETKATELVDHIRSGTAVFKSPKNIFWATFWTGMIWWMVIVNVQIISSVFEESLSWGQAGIVSFVVAAAVTLPQAPGYVGSFQLGCMIALNLCFGVDEAVALAIAWMIWCFQIFPVILLGFIAMFVEGMSFRSFSEARESLEDEE